MRDLLMRMLGYKHKYYELTWKTPPLYTKHCRTEEEGAKVREKVAWQFGHMHYIIKKKLRSGKTTKVYLSYFKNENKK